MICSCNIPSLTFAHLMDITIHLISWSIHFGTIAVSNINKICRCNSFIFGFTTTVRLKQQLSIIIPLLPKTPIDYSNLYFMFVWKHYHQNHQWHLFQIKKQIIHFLCICFSHHCLHPFEGGVATSSSSWSTVSLLMMIVFGVLVAIIYAVLYYFYLHTFQIIATKTKQHVCIIFEITIACAASWHVSTTNLWHDLFAAYSQSRMQLGCC